MFKNHMRAVSVIGMALMAAGFISLQSCKESPAGNGRENEVRGAEKGEGRGGSVVAEETKSDLDRTVAALLAETCEHKKRMYLCDECRYEVGVARAPKSFFENGLLKTARVAKRGGETGLALTGEIVFDDRKVARLTPMAAGVVSRVMVDLGRQVVSGQELVTLKSADLAQAEGDFLEAESRLGLARKTYERQKALRDAGITAERELVDAEAELAVAGIRVDSARQKLSRFGLAAGELESLSTKGIKGAKGEIVLRAPFPGAVLELQARAGELVSPGERVVLVGDLAGLWIWADLYERDLPGVLKMQRSGGIPVSVRVNAFPDREFTGRVDFIGAVMDEKSRTVKIRITVGNPEGKLLPGMFASVRLKAAVQRDVLVVPSAAVLSDEGRDFVFVHQEGDYFIRRPVVKGAESEGFTEIKLGLEEGLTVVSEGAFLLKSDVLRSKMGAGCAD